MHRWKALTILVAAALLAPLATTAGAAERTSVDVATNGSLRLTAVDDPQRVGSLCLDLLDGKDTLSSGSCTDPGGFLEVGGTAPGASQPALGAVVPGDAARVEVRRAGRVLTTAPTTPGPGYRGRRAGDVGFALLLLPAGSEQDGLRVRALAADGTLLTTVSDLEGGPRTTGVRVLLSGRRGGTRWKIKRSRVTRSAPTLADPARETAADCVETELREGRLADANRTTCIGEEPLDAFTGSGGISSSGVVDDNPGILGGPQTLDACRRPYRLLSGTEPAGLRRVTATLGDGETRRARLSRPGADTRRSWALVVPESAAVRSVRVEVAGRKAETRPLGLPPVAVGCAFQRAGGSPGLGRQPAFDLTQPFGGLLGPIAEVTPVGPVTTVPGSPAFRVADGPAGTLCLAVGTAAFSPLGCRAVSTGVSLENGAVDDLDRPTAIAVAVSARVATVRVGSLKGPSTDIETFEAPGYTGAYAGRVRFAVIPVPTPDAAALTQLLDASGRVLAETRDESGPEDGTPRFGRTRRAAGAAGRPSLWRTPVGVGKQSIDCLALTSGPAPRRRDACALLGITDEAPAVLLDVPCSPGRASVAAFASTGSRAQVVVDGRARALRLRRGVGLVTLRSGARLGTLQITPKRGRALRVDLNTRVGTGQCGWRVTG